MNLATSGYFNDSLDTIQTRWSFADVIHAQITIETIVDLKPDPPENPRG